MALLQQIKVPLLAVNDTVLTIIEINFKNASSVKKGDIVMVFETSKTTFSVEAEEDGFIKYLCSQGEDYEVNTIVAEIYSEKEETKIIELSSAGADKSIFSIKIKNDNSEISNWDGKTLFSEDALTLINNLGLDKASFKMDMVNKNDVELFHFGELSTKKDDIVLSNTQNAKKVKKGFLPDNVIEEPISGNKKREIEFLSSVQKTGLTSTIHIWVDTKGLFLSTNKYFTYFKNSLLPLVIYETSRLLNNYKILNSFFDDNKLYLYQNVNIGFAVDLDKGLKVLKIKDSDKKSMNEIENTMMSLSNSYLDDKLSIDDLTDITFTVTDLSSEGITFFKPLVNMQNAAILGVSAIDNKLQRAYLSLTFDHRITEGKLVSAFLNQLKIRIESYKFNDENSSEYNDINCHKCFKTLKDDLSGMGLIPCITPKGKEGYICQTCWNGL